jgi:repressor LexA
MTAIQIKILNFIADHVKSHGYPPTIREIGDGVGLKSSSSVHNHLINLSDSGYIRFSPGRSRTIRVLRTA